MTDTVLGNGATAFVYKVLSKATGKYYALKVLDKEKIVREKLQTRLINEIRIHGLMSGCPLIAELYHSFEDESNVYMLIEYVEGVELFKHYKAQIAENTSKNGVLLGLSE